MPVSPPSLNDIHAARARLSGIAVRTPLVRFTGDPARDIHLKLESLQPIGSFKLRGAANAMAIASPAELADGVYTASAGNMAQGVAWCARERGIRCRVVVPEHAPRTKTEAIERLGGEVIRVPFDQWWQTLIDRGRPDFDGLFVHPFADTAVMAGNGTVALEIFDDLADIDAIIVPYGGGGLACGIAAAARAVSPRTKVYAVEVDTPRGRYGGMMNLGGRPTFGDERREIEAHLFDADGGFYGDAVQVGFVARLRETRRFAGPEALIKQLAADEVDARRALTLLAESAKLKGSMHFPPSTP